MRACTHSLSITNSLWRILSIRPIPQPRQIQYLQRRSNTIIPYHTRRTFTSHQSHLFDPRFDADLNFLDDVDVSEIKDKPSSPRRRKYQSTSSSTQPPADEAIRSYRIHVVYFDPERGKTAISEPTLLKDALAKLKVDTQGRRIEALRQVQAPTDERPLPICKYFDIIEEREKEVTRKKAERALKMARKSLELNWTVEDNDLAHRMKQMRQFLQKGCRVDVVLGSARKRGWMGKRTDDLEAARRLIENIQSVAMEVPGTKEMAMRGILGQEARLVFEGKRTRASGEAVAESKRSEEKQDPEGSAEKDMRETDEKDM